MGFSECAEAGEDRGFLDERVVEGVGDVQSHAAWRDRGSVAFEDVHGAHLGHGVGAHLQFEPDQPFSEVGDCGADRAGAVEVCGALGGVVDDRVQVGAGAHRRVDSGHRRRQIPLVGVQAGGEHIVGQAHHRLHDLGRGVVHAGLAAQRRVVDREERLVEVDVGVFTLLPDRLPLHGPDHPAQQVNGDAEGSHRAFGQ